jgi:superfamily II RNA helicase
MYHVHNLKQAIPDVEHPYDFPLDPFQRHALHAIANDENVLVTAKTGSGKTLVGEYQIYHSLKKGKRVFYTTPIKSLTNQKFHDLKKMYPSVGIMTGDIKFCPQADIVVLTTEILRNLLYKQGSVTEKLGITAELSLDGVDAIVFDEVHYINDPSRGHVWEECMILLPPEIHMVLLSATLDHPEAFAEWLGNLKQVPVHLISTDYRVVPLIHKVGDEVLMDEKNTYHPDVYLKYLTKLRNSEDALRKRKDAVRGREAGDPVVAKKDQTHSFVHQLNEQIGRMNEETQLPALFFVFSRKMCEEYAHRVTHDLLTSSETANVRHILSFHLHRYTDLQTLKQYHDLEKLLLKGIAYHHSGMLPILKEIVELLFGRGYIRVLFATETFAVGLNMPTKTVVFTSFRKYDDMAEDLRLLRTDEYLQMAGRAGRRGKDTQGLVYYLPDRKPESPADVKAMMTGHSATVSSQMDFHYDFILKSMQSGRLNWETILTSSYWYAQAQQRIRSLERQKEVLMCRKPASTEECEQRETLENAFKKASNETRKDAQRALEQWKNKHAAPSWDQAWKDYKDWKSAQRLMDALDLNIEREKAVTEPVERRLAYLEHTGFLKDGQLTKLGRMAAEINEGHPLVMARAFADKVLHGCKPHDLVAILASFVDGKLCRPIDPLEPIYKELQNEEYPRSTPDYWFTSNMWCDPVHDWLEGHEFGSICEHYGVDAGSFVRTILKVANVVDEWVNIATFCEDLEMLETCRGLKETLIRGLVVPDSLYLHV